MHAAGSSGESGGGPHGGRRRCVGQDLNLRTPSGQRPQRCAFDQAGPPTHVRLSSRASILIFLQGLDAASRNRCIGRPQRIIWRGARRREWRAMPTRPKSRPAKTRTFDVINPATEKALATYPILTATQVRSKVQAAREAFASWSRLDPKER